MAVAGMLARAGHQAWFVGGCVRDVLLGRDPGDVDLSTDARPDRVMELSRDAGLKPVPTGIDHGTVTVVSGGVPFEVTTFRRDVQTDGRRAVVAFADSIAQDAQRRDFTFNALYMDRDGAVADPTGGMADLAARRLRFVGSARDRVAEDYLRILRLFRFLAWFGEEVDEDALDACARGADGIARLSRERVTAETSKLLSAPDPAPAVAMMEAAGVLRRVAPGASCAALAPMVHWEGGARPDWRARLVALGGAPELRLSKADARAVEAFRDAVTMAPHEIGYALRDLAPPALALRAALTGAAVTDADRADLAAGQAARFPLAAADLIDRVQGPALGAALREAEAAWVRSKFTATKSDLLG
ncbi:MAG: CCA tRNA nucleotidyltransferase [Paracoccaceae bacterium]